MTGGQEVAGSNPASPTIGIPGAIQVSGLRGFFGGRMG